MSYYPPQGSHYSHNAPPIVYTSSHHSHGGYDGGYPQYASSSAYYDHPSSHLGAPGVVYVPSHRSSRSHSRHRRHHGVPQVISTSGGQVAYPSSGYHHSSRHHRHHHLSFGDRIRRFFGMAPRAYNYKRKSNNSSWGFLGRSRRRTYVDGYGTEVDKRGRPVIRV